MSTDRNTKLRVLHARVRAAGVGEETYRDRLQREFGVRSAKGLTDEQLGRAIDLFHVKSNANFPHTRKVKALWIALANLGAVDRSDAALDAFIERQTGKARLTFLTPAEANKVTEGLKAMCAREGFELAAGDRDASRVRHALLRAQWKKLAQLGAVRIDDDGALLSWLDRKYKTGCHGGAYQLTVEQLDNAANALGRWIASTLKKKSTAA